MTGAHQIDADRLTRADQVAQRLLLIARHPDRMQLTGQQQPGEKLGVTSVGLDAVPRASYGSCRAPRGWSRATSTSPHQLRGGTGPFHTAGRTDGQSILSRRVGV